MSQDGSELAAQLKQIISKWQLSILFSDPAWCVLADPVLVHTHPFLWAHQVAPASEGGSKQLPSNPRPRLPTSDGHQPLVRGLRPPGSPSWSV